MDTRFRHFDRELTAGPATDGEDSQADSLRARARGLARAGTQVLDAVDSTVSQDSREFNRQSKQDGGQ